MKGILGRKIGMTQLFTEKNQLLPITVIEVQPNVVLQVKTNDSDGYDALKLAAFDKPERLINKPDQGQFQKAKTTFKRKVHEIRNMNGDFKMGQALTASDVFTTGDYVDVSGISKGKGFAGVIKRYNFSCGPMAHGSGYHRGIGSLGSVRAKRIFKNKKMPGHMGHVNCTVANQQIVKIDNENNLLLIKGSVPGPNKQFVVIKETVKQKKRKSAPEIFQFIKNAKPSSVLNNRKEN